MDAAVLLEVQAEQGEVPVELRAQGFERFGPIREAARLHEGMKDRDERASIAVLALAEVEGAVQALPLGAITGLVLQPGLGEKS